MASNIQTTDATTPVLRTKGHSMPDILYHSTNYLAVNKGCDIKINSNNREEMSVEQQLRVMKPELVDPNCFHAFRYKDSAADDKQ